MAEFLVGNVRGIQGERGPQGIPGDTAYEVAVKNGFTGTEPEWLNSITSVSITAYSAWESWHDSNPGENTLTFDEWVDRQLRLGDDELARIRAKLEWESAKVSIYDDPGKQYEYWTGEYWDGDKKIYGKIVKCKPLVNGAVAINTPHGIANMITPVAYSGYVISLSAKRIFHLPSSANPIGGSLAIEVNSDNIIMGQWENWANYLGATDVYCTIKYICSDR